MVQLVVYFVFVLVMMLLFSIGILVLLYHLKPITSYYGLRGGVSSAGEYNGIFYVHMAFNASTSYWPYGAALDCFILFYAWWF